MTQQYNRERTLAIVTGIVCALIFLAGTALGAIHSIMALGAFGILSVACYLIADAAIIWAAFIDYKEDGTPMEWTALAVKYILSAYILFSGGCIAWLMISERHDSTAQLTRTQIYQKAYSDCMAIDGAKTRSCERMAKELLANESATEKEKVKENNDNAGFVKSYVDWPLFKYFPGLLGLFGLFILALVSKLSPQESEGTKLLQTSTRHFRSPNPQASFTPPPSSLPSISNGLRGRNNAAFRFKAHGNSMQITWRGNGREYACGSVSIPEANVMTTLDYKRLAMEIIKRRGKNDSTSQLIAATI